jgi:hypothetical protein
VLAAPTTSWNPDFVNDFVEISWTPVDDGGSPWTAYTVLIQQSDSAYSEEISNCDGTQSSIIASATCLVPVSALRTAPFNLDWGTHVYARVIATNVYGSAEASEAGNGAKITTYPDQPTGLAED